MSEGRPEVYVASPLGFTRSTEIFMNERLLPAIREAGAQPINPWEADATLTRLLSAAREACNLGERRERWNEVTRYAGARNVDFIKRCAGLVAVLDGSDVDSGTASEIGYATALGKWTIGYRGDLRMSGEDPVAHVNLQVEFFVYAQGGTIVFSLDELKEALRTKATS